jgi:hypothetical protein
MPAMFEYIAAVKRALRDTYPDKVRVIGGSAFDPLCQVPDGVYPVKVFGKLDHVKIENDNINCCNFDGPPAENRK